LQYVLFPKFCGCLTVLCLVQCYSINADLGFIDYMQAFDRAECITAGYCINNQHPLVLSQYRIIHYVYLHGVLSHLFGTICYLFCMKFWVGTYSRLPKTNQNAGCQFSSFNLTLTSLVCLLKSMALLSHEI